MNLAMLSKQQQRAAAARRHAPIGVALAFVAGVLFWWPRLSAFSDQLTFLDKISYDLIYAIRPAQPPDRGNFQIIEIDSQTYRTLQPDSEPPLDRSFFTRLLGKLSSDGASVVIFDVIFQGKKTESDAVFAKALRDYGKAAIAADVEPVVRDGIRGWNVMLPDEPMRSAVARIGTIGMPQDSHSLIQRRHFHEIESHESLPWAAARLAGSAKIDRINRTEERWLNYYGEPGSVVPAMSFSDALQQSAGYFTNKAVFIGGSPSVPIYSLDSHRTPYTRWNGRQSAGVELLTINYLNLVHGDWLTRCPAFVELAMMFIVAILGGFGFVRFRPVVGALLAPALVLIIITAAVVLHINAHVWFSWAIMTGIEVPTAWAWALFVSLKHHSRETSGSRLPVVQSSPASPELVVPMTSRVADHELIRKVGRGAYGEVWLARNAIGLFHAVKIIKRSEFEDEVPFERELRGVTKFMPISRSHPGFVNILHVGRDDSAGFFYCVMEAADDEKFGQEIPPDSYSPMNLSRYLAVRKRLPPAECLQLGLKLADALDHLHRTQLIHRDIKPSNIIFVNGAPKLADIGLVTKIADKPGDISYLGTRGYIAPEGPSTPASDIYSLGKVLYEAFTGLDREQFPNLPSSLLNATTGRFSKLNLIILKACEADPKNRYRSAAELRVALEVLGKLRRGDSP